MCNALQELVDKSRLEGLHDGRLEGLHDGRLEGLINSIAICKDLGCSQELTIEKILSKFSLPEEEAKEYVKKYW